MREVQPKKKMPAAMTSEGEVATGIRIVCFLNVHGRAEKLRRELQELQLMTRGRSPGLLGRASLPWSRAVLCCLLLCESLLGPSQPRG